MNNCFFIFILSVCVTANSCKKKSEPPGSGNNPSDDGLIAYYPFNGNTYDESGNHYDLQNHGAALTINRNGEPNKAYLFDGTTNFMAVPPLIKADSLREFTISVWVKPRAARQNVIFSFLPKLNNTSCAGYIGVSNNATALATLHRLPFSISGSTCISAIIKDEVAVTSETWFHVVLVQHYSPGNSYSTYYYDQYVNGVKLKGNSSSIDISPDPVSFGKGGIVGGNNNTQDFNLNFDLFDGAIDDIRIYNRSLSENDIQKLYSFKE